MLRALLLLATVQLAIAISPPAQPRSINPPDYKPRSPPTSPDYRPRSPPVPPDYKAHSVKRQDIPSGTASGGQPSRQVSDDLLGGFEHVGETGVSAQMMFLGTKDKVYILDKVENNALQVAGHPAWAVEYDLNSNQLRAMDIETNSFCAGGGQIGTGVWINVGGNQAVEPRNDGTGDVQDAANQMGDNAYGSWDGRNVTRILNPGEGSEWVANPEDIMTSRRWYPAVGTLPDGRAIIIGGNNNGGFVNDAFQNNPTYEFFPRHSADEGNFPMPFLERTLPANLFTITDLLPSGNLLLVSNQNAIIFNPSTAEERNLTQVPHAVRTYPASASTVMLPIRAKDNYRATVLYCGGSDISPPQWTDGSNLIQVPATASCISMTGDEANGVADDWVEEDDLPEGRVMGNAILLPDGKVLVVNGANTGVAGYDMVQPWTFQNSLANNPVLEPVIYDPEQPAGQRWSRDGLKGSDIARMYHSTATLLPDGSVFIAGSNPHPDVNLQSDFPTEYRAERFYPLYYNHVRPSPTLPTHIGYGGQYFDVDLSLEGDLFNNVGNAMRTKAVLMKTGFSTHALNFGQRMVELDTSFTKADRGGGVTLHVSPPPGPTIIQPGTAWLFIVVDGIPSVGVQVLIGSGTIEDQFVEDTVALPTSDQVDDDPSAETGGSGSGHSSAATLSSPANLVFAGGLMMVSITAFL